MNDTPKKRVLELDLLRAAAIFLVLGRHMLWIPDSAVGVVAHVLRAWNDIGWTGVDLFFVISGFLVGGLLIREGLKFGFVRPGLFLLRRGLRIYPPFYLFLTVTCLLAYFGWLRLPAWPRGLLAEVFFLQNYIEPLWPHTWSLAIEEHFYIFLVVLIFFMTSRFHRKPNPFQTLPWIILGINSVVLVGRTLAGYSGAAGYVSLYSQSQWRLDALLMGVLLAYGFQRYPEKMSSLRRSLHPWLVPGLAVLCLPSLMLDPRRNMYVCTVGVTTLYVGLTWMILELLDTQYFTKSRWAKPLGFLPWIGRHSYSIYLWHFLINDFAYSCVHRFFHWNPPYPYESFIYMAAAIGGGICMSMAVEIPTSRWRNRHFPARISALPDSLSIRPAS